MSAEDLPETEGERQSAEERLAALTELAIERGAAARRRRRLRSAARPAGLDSVENRLALRCGRLEREVQAFIEIRRREVLETAAPPSGERRPAFARRSVPAPRWLSSFALGVLLAALWFGLRRPDVEATHARESSEAFVTLPRGLTSPGPGGTGAPLLPPEPVDHSAEAVPVADVRSPDPPQRPEPKEPDEPDSRAVAVSIESPTPVQCEYAADTSPGAELRNILGPCLARQGPRGVYRDAGRTYCAHHQFFARGLAGSLVTARADAAFAQGEGVLSPLVRQRIERGALRLLRTRTTERLQPALMRVSIEPGDPSAAPARYRVAGSVVAEDEEGAARERAFALVLDVRGDTAGDLAITFEWTAPAPDHDR